MSEPHTADLATRYRYRQEGAKQERERIIKLLEKKFAEGSEHICENCDIWFEIKGEQK